ncbi:MAG: DUF4115 domain-containing protein, partial [Burkholderiales bacterium]|nr:DUF4115 domain-containing protein [Burkholderiales bacterium]
ALYFVPSGLWTPHAVPAVLAASVAPPTASVAMSAPASAALPTITPQAASASPEPAASTAPAAGSTPALTPTPASAPPPVAAAAAGGVLQLRVRGPSWVEAKDAKGQVLLSRLLQPGEHLGLDGALPIRLVIGDATVTQVQFRGQPVDLAPSTRNNVARLQLP